MMKLSSFLDRFSSWTGASVAWLTLAMMIITCLIVVLRYQFNMGSIALQESVVYLHGMVFMLGIAATLRHKAHVRVDIFYNQLGQKGRAIVDLTGTFIFLFPLALFIFGVSLQYVHFTWTLHEASSEPGGLPGVYLLKTLIPIFAILLFLQGVSEVIKNINLLVAASTNGGTHSVETDFGI